MSTLMTQLVAAFKRVVDQGKFASDGYGCLYITAEQHSCVAGWWLRDNVPNLDLSRLTANMPATGLVPELTDITHHDAELLRLAQVVHDTAYDACRIAKKPPTLLAFERAACSLAAAKWEPVSAPETHYCCGPYTVRAMTLTVEQIKAWLLQLAQELNHAQR